MLTLSNVLPCQLHPGSNAAISSLHDSQMRRDFQEFCGSQVSLTGRCPVSYFGRFNQAFPNYEPSCTLPPAAFPGNAGASPVCCNPSPPQNQVIHIFPTFVNVTSVQEKRPHVHPQVCHGPTELTRQGRLPPISMFSSSIHRHHNLCGDIKRDNLPVNDCGPVNYNEMSVYRTKFEPSLTHETPNCNKFQYSLEVVNTRKKQQVFKSTKVVQGHRKVKKTITSSVRYCKKLQGLMPADIPHSIASILDAPTTGLVGAESGSVQKSRPPQEQLVRAGFFGVDEREGAHTGYSVGSDASLDESNDDKSDVDVTSCSGDENEEDGENGSSPSESAQCFSAQKKEGNKLDVICKQKELGINPPVQHQPQEASDRSPSSNRHTNGICSTESHSPIKTDNEQLLSNVEHVPPATFEDKSLNSFTLNTENGKCFQRLQLSNIHGTSLTPLNTLTKSLPPIESLCHTDVRKTENDAPSAFTPIAKVSAFPDMLWCPKIVNQIRGGELTQLFKIDACSDKGGYDKLKLIHQMQERNEAIKQQVKENRNVYAKSRYQTSESVETDAVNMLRHQSFLYQNPHNEALGEGAVPDTAGAWFHWLQQRDIQPVGPRPETTHMARCPPPPPPRYHCDACNKTYSTFGGLSKHRQFHCSEHVRKEFACNVCSKSYSSLGALKMHIRTHTLPCKCHVCGKAFSRPWLLQGHVRTHTGEKPFRCSHCGRAFADRSNLRAHLQTHAEIKKYACRKCGKTFSRMSLLTKHTEGSCPGNSKSLVQ